jgi:TolB-like protein
MTEALIGAIAQIDGLRVISRTSIMRFQGDAEGRSRDRTRAKVDVAITGSVRRVGDRVRISAQLIDASDAHVWAANLIAN